MVLLAGSRCALNDIDPLIAKLWGINISQEYIDWVVNLPAEVPNTPVSLAPPSLSAALLNNEMRRPVIGRDPFSH